MEVSCDGGKGKSLLAVLRLGPWGIAIVNDLG